MEIGKLAEKIVEKRRAAVASYALLTGISGIDASGKGHVTTKLAERISNHNVVVINVDGWLNLPNVRFDPLRPAENFYENALRLDEMFESLISPLKKTRRVDIAMDYTDETATEYRTHRYKSDDVDVILLEGIFLFKRRFVDHFDLKLWVDCSFETALERAIDRGQEGLAKEETIRAYETIYFPAQRIHLKRDNPKAVADLTFDND